MRARVTQRYARMRREFSAYVRDISAKLKRREMSLVDVPVKEASYKITLEDSLGYKETWYVFYIPGTYSLVYIAFSFLKHCITIV